MNTPQPLREIVRSAARTGPRAARFTLATDLDGTLLAGSQADRVRLAAALRDARTIFVTGRALESVRPLLLDPVIPRPAYVIADVGATVVEGRDCRPVQPLQAAIDAAWPGARRVREALARHDRLVPQLVPQERRCSYYLDDLAAVTPALAASVRALGCDLLVSAGRYLDVLPRGVSKGATLMALLEHLGIDHDEVIVAGDTLNDLSMFLVGLTGVVVRNAEPALLERLKGARGIRFARGEGAAGILEALAADPTSDSRTQPDRRQLLVLYHRVPTDLRRSPNGIIPSLLHFFADGRVGTWIGWSIAEDDAEADAAPSVSVEHPGLTIAPITLPRRDVERFYHRFAKEALWPVIFSFPGRVEFSQADWDHYVDINRRFAERAAHAAEPGALVWIHDYNLWMAPGFLRKLRPDLRLAFFHHTAFPSADIFGLLPWRRQILDSLLACDYIGFHVPRYVENFVDVVASDRPVKVIARVQVEPRFTAYGCALGVASMATGIEANGRSVGLGAHPVGVDVARIRAEVAAPEVVARVAELRRRFAGRTAILSVERLDYVKGQLQKLRAFERLLDRHPELRGTIVFINVVTPPAAGMTIHDTLGEQLDLAVGRINERFGTMDWSPVEYFKCMLPFADIVAHYAACDIAWITPLRDGLNLVAKEYIAVRSACARGGDGVLVLSEFAGAAVELRGALLTNPYDEAGMVDTLISALTLAPAERRECMASLVRTVEQHDVHRWGEQFLAAAGGGPP
jgi:glucosylglycerol-phosphate synthase